MLSAHTAAPYEQSPPLRLSPPILASQRGLPNSAGDWVFVSGPATFGTAGKGPSAIQVYNRTSGALEQTIVVLGEALAFERAREQRRYRQRGAASTL